MLSLSQPFHHKHFFKIVILFSLIGIVISLIILRSKNPPSNQITPGKTETKTLLEKQTPFNTVTQGNYTEYYVGDPNSRNNTTYVEKNGIIEYYLERNKQKFIHPNYQGYLNEFGDPNLTRYNDWYTYAGFKVEVFLKPGIAVTVHPDSKSIIEEWHFTPGLSPELFDANYSHIFSKTPPEPKNKF